MHGRILVAVSGGLDSVVALHLILSCFPDRVIAVAHLDHGARPDSSRDARWVARLADRLGVDFISERAVTASHTETMWRQQRYAFLSRAADCFRADAVVTAHHADDQAETVLFRIARGAGTRGLSGIPERRGRVVRPLLPFHRYELHAYARARELEWVEDASNSDMRHARNRIRRRLLPALEAASPGATGRLLRIAALAKEAESYWDEELATLVREAVISRRESGFTLATDVLRGYHPRIRARVLRYLCRQLGAAADRSGTDAAAKFIMSGRSGGRVMLNRDIRLECAFDSMLLERVRAGTPGEAMAEMAIPSSDPGCADLEIGGRAVRLRWSVETGPVGVEDVAFDPAALPFPLVLRGWRAGDQIRFSYGSKKLKKLFVERRIERSRRHEVPVLAEQGTGAVLWVAGIARAAVAVPVSGAPTFRIRIEE